VLTIQTESLEPMSSNPTYIDYADGVDPDPDPGPPRRRGRRVLKWVAIVTAVLVVAAGATGYGFYWQLQHNIDHEDTDKLIGGNRPPKLNSALNILMLGTDSRAGANAKYGRGLKNDPPRSDTMILLHLSPGGKQATGISFPRDLMVPIPACRRTDGTTSPAATIGMINSSFTNGGASCTVKTIEDLTHIKIDHFMQVDFTSFKSVTEAVGGVEVCLPQDVNDKDSKLHLTRGKHTIQGETALAYVRDRHGLGDESDLQRIKRQQQFMGSLANKVLSAGTLTDPKKVYDLAEAGTKSLTTDKGLDLGTMVKIARSMHGLTAGKLDFVTVPVTAYAPDPNRVALSQPSAGQFFTAVRQDQSVEAAAKKTSGPVQVRLYNATGTASTAAKVAKQLKAQGFVIVGTATMQTRPTTGVYYAQGSQAQAAALAAVIPGAKKAVYPKAGPGVVNLVLGTSFTAVKAKKKAGIPTLEGEIHADGDICAAGA
jgi:LCP family protein required for cell wall assembly